MALSAGTSIVNILNTKEGNDVYNAALRDAIIKAANGTRLVSYDSPIVIDGSVNMSFPKIAAFDDSKPHLKDNSLRYIKVIDEYSLTRGVDVSGVLIDSIGGQIGLKVNGNCTTCVNFETKISAINNPAIVSVDVMGLARCKYPNAVCPDQRDSMWLEEPNFLREYMGDFSTMTHDGFNTPINVRHHSEKPPPRVKEEDIELEIKRLNENFGLF